MPIASREIQIILSLQGTRMQTTDTLTDQQRCFTQAKTVNHGVRVNTIGLSLAILHDSFAICKLGADENIPDWTLSESFCSITRTSDELSIVCPQELVPKGIEAEMGWRSLKVEGKLDFGMVGILSSITSSLAKVGIVVFVISTYDTDYILVKDSDLDRATAALRNAGHNVH